VGTGAVCKVNIPMPDEDDSSMVISSDHTSANSGRHTMKRRNYRKDCPHLELMGEFAIKGSFVPLAPFITEGLVESSGSHHSRTMKDLNVNRRRELEHTPLCATSHPVPFGEKE
jgi:hypothetical protein